MIRYNETYKFKFFMHIIVIAIFISTYQTSEGAHFQGASSYQLVDFCRNWYNVN